VKDLAASTRTAQLAADVIGAPLGSIVKSLIFLGNKALDTAYADIALDCVVPVLAFAYFR
jgi:hypothetical protein